MKFYPNSFLVKKQGLSEEEVKLIVLKHEEREKVFEQMERIEDPRMLHSFASLVELIEFELQKLWKFPQDAQQHCWWFRVPHCRCPKLDNAERVGTGQRVINGDCPVHGFEEEVSRLPNKPLC